VIRLEKKEKKFIIRTKSSNFISKAVIIASGTEENKLKVVGEEEFTNFGVSYCAICDGFFFRGKEVAVIGGGYSALETALHMSNIAKQVYLIHRSEKFRVDPEIKQKVQQDARIKLILNSVVNEIGGEIEDEKKKLTHLIIEEKKGSNTMKKKLLVSAVFPCIGLSPFSNFSHELGVCDKERYISIREDCSTLVPGLFAAGDVARCSEKKIRQIVTATAEGSIAAQSAIKYLKNNFE
jgi:thioredoxin reductase (NADPH)